MKRELLILLLVLIIPVLVWTGCVIHVFNLTAKYAEEFTDFQAIGYDYIHPWEGMAELRVLSYGHNSATVYFFSSTGGEKVKFIRNINGWTYSETLAIWSTTGSADDYFIWPFFKDYVI